MKRPILKGFGLRIVKYKDTGRWCLETEEWH